MENTHRLLVAELDYGRQQRLDAILLAPMLVALALVPAAAAAAPPVAILLVAAPRLVIVTAAFESVAHGVPVQEELKVVCLLRINCSVGPTTGLTRRSYVYSRNRRLSVVIAKLFKALGGSVSCSCVAGKSFVLKMPVHANSAVMAC